MKRSLFLMVFFAFLVLSLIVVGADIILPAVTFVYFQDSSLEYPIDFKIECYGHTQFPGAPAPINYTSEKVFGFSATCPKYGCEIYQNYYLNYRHVDYCSLYGKAANKDFSMEKYSNDVFPNCGGADINNDGMVDVGDLGVLSGNWRKSNCSWQNLYCNGADINNDGMVDNGDFGVLSKNYGKTHCIPCRDMRYYDLYFSGKYYNSTSEYKTCAKNNTYSASHCFQYLIETTKNESTWMINGKYYKRDLEGKYDACQKQAYQDYLQRKQECNKYLIEITPEFERDSSGKIITRKCEMWFSP